MPPPTPLNYFTNIEVAAHYAQVRPFFHQDVVSRVCALTGTALYRRVLDVGCGSGQSSIALAEVAEHVVALDPSEQMLHHAQPHPKIAYRVGVAEELNCAQGEFDVISVGSALHWFDQHRFFAQCQHALSSDGVLMIYNDHFTAHLEGVVACKHWMRTRYAKRFRPSRRGMRDMDEPTAVEHGFAVAHCTSFDHHVPFSRQEFISYLMTCSNTIAAIQSGRETHESAQEWLDAELEPIIPDGVTRSFIFKCNIWVLRRAVAA